ncbi:MAG: hypothetical protein ABI207_04225 [Crocinitomicaceae bacterium]
MKTINVMKNKLLIFTLSLIICSCGLQRQSPISRKLFVSQPVKVKEIQNVDTLSKKSIEIKTIENQNSFQLKMAEVSDVKTISDKKIQLKSTFLKSSSHLLKNLKNIVTQKNIRTKLSDEDQNKSIKKAKAYSIVSIILALLAFLFIVAAMLVFTLLFEYIISMLIALVGMPFAIIGIILYPLYKKKIRGLEIDPKEKAKMKRRARAGLILSIVFLGMLGFVLLFSLMGNFS